MVLVEDLTEKTLYDDLKGFLKAERVDLRRAATQAVLQVTNFQEMEQIVQHGLVKELAKNVSHPDKEVSIQALKGLVQLSSHGTSANQCVEDLMEAGGLNRMLEIVLGNPSDQGVGVWKQQVNYAMSLLANITRTENGSIELVGLSMPEKAVSREDVEAIEKQPTKPSLELILSRFLNPELVDEVDYTDLEGESLDSDPSDAYQHFAAVIMNTSQIEAGRKFCLKLHNEAEQNEQGWTVFQKLLSQLKSPNPLRRRGIAGLVRNCCIDRDSSWWMLNVVHLTKYLLYPLAGPEELDVDEKTGLDPDLWLEGPDKKREVDHYTRLYLVESILLLCASGRKSREQLRLERVYVILKWADMVEEQEDVSECIDECVQFLRRDEEGTEEGSSDKFVSEAYRKPSTSIQVGINEDFDEVD